MAGLSRFPALAVAAALLVCLGERSAAADDEENTCADCHTVLDPPLNTPVEAMENDIHAQKGFQCVDCHGGDPTSMEDTVSMSRERGFTGKPKHTEIAPLCGRCHSDGAFMRRFNPSLPTDQQQQYARSVHGQRLRQGDEKVATCVSCHGAHGILPRDKAESPVFAANVPSTCGRCHSQTDYMAEYGIPTDQVTKYEESVHGRLLLVQRDFSAPACNDCHGNHGAFPPGATSVAEVCGTCHANNAALFIKSPHRQAFDERDLPECATCHSNHDIEHPTDEMLGGAEGTVCRRCHLPGSAGHDAAVKMRGAIAHLKAVMGHAEATLERAKRMGMEVSDEEYALREGVRPQLIQIRTETHLCDVEAVMAAVNEAANAANENARAAEGTLAEAQARRRNLLLPLALIVILMFLLRLKLRQLERPTRRSTGA